MASVFSLYKKSSIIIFSVLTCIVLFILSSVALCKLFYPVCYIDEVKVYSKKYEIDPYLVLAIINTESGFDRLATSNRGAVGLMQIMPSTAEAIASDLDFVGFKTEDLYNPNVNIEFGCYYVLYLSDKFDSIEKVLFAYNAGEGTLQRFLNDNNGEFLVNNIQINETRNFIYKVEKAYNHYKRWCKV